MTDPSVPSSSPAAPDSAPGGSAIARFNSRFGRWIVWILRIAVGATFIFSGFSKVVDPWGFIYKIQDYLNVWGIHWLWREAVTCIAVAISTVEFVMGVLLVGGCLRRAVCQGLAAFMLFMLPLSAYIAIASPVSDCGCFGDAWVISNTATFWKNVALTAAIVYLLFNNTKAGCIFAPLTQWMVIAVSLIYCIVLAVAGMSVQPLYDFRPFRIGTSLAGFSNDDDAAEQLRMIYEKDGITQEFEIDNLPDSTWTFVGRNIAIDTRGSDFAIFEGEDDVTSEVLVSEGPQMLLVVNDPYNHKKARASMANSINDYINTYGGSMIGVVATRPDSLDSWSEAAHPHFDVYTADDTALKELVRGDAALVYLTDGVIRWKRNIYSLPGDFPDFEAKTNVLEQIPPVDDGRYLRNLTVLYLSFLAFIFILGLIRIRRDAEFMPKISRFSYKKVDKDAFASKNNS